MYRYVYKGYEVGVSSEYIAVGGLFLFLDLSRLYSELVLLLLYFCTLSFNWITTHLKIISSFVMLIFVT